MANSHKGVIAERHILQPFGGDGINFCPIDRIGGSQDHSTLTYDYIRALAKRGPTEPISRPRVDSRPGGRVPRRQYCSEFPKGNIPVVEVSAGPERIRRTRFSARPANPVRRR